MREKPALRTCVSAVRDPEGPARPDLAPEGNIVRGED